MIVKMNKYAWLVYHKEYAVFLERLRTLGVVHVKRSKPTQDHPVIQRLRTEDKQIKTQLDYLNGLLEAEDAKLKAEKKNSKESVPGSNDTVKPAESESALLSRTECKVLLGRIEDLREKGNKIQSSLLLKEKERDTISVWGDFSYDNLVRLRNAGYNVGFYTCSASQYDESWEDCYNAFVINTVQSVVYFITITRSGTEMSINADQAKMPLKDYRHLGEEIEQEGKNKEEIEARLLEIARQDCNSLKNLKKEVENESAWHDVLIQTAHGADDKLMLLEGWIPDDKTAEMEKSLGDSGYFYLKMDITDDDVIPIELRNNKFTKLFEPITRLYSLPNYKEFDPTPLFAPFFMLFFGLCLGDGGYGLLLILASIILKPKVSESMKPIMTLVLYFGITTLVIGTLTGTFFGFSIIEVKALSSVKDYFITTDNLMIISLVIGFFHVIYAKFIAAIKIKIQRGFKYSLSAFAWIFVILAFACIFVLPMANIQLSKLVEYILYGIIILCGAIALFYNTPGKNIFLNFGSGLWATYNTVSGLVGDVLSYIRLYAIGLTSALLGGVFNSMAIDMTASMNPFVRWLPMLLILLVGHALNIGLSLISSLVHPLRLTYVEYYKNSEFEGGGLDYKPFKKS
ncbi:MAG: ATPase [Tannerella sp.]|jgi:V/A-type H+-transporting ATPase subunit I|nr:ATPase [Tannerella sp.]